MFKKILCATDGSDHARRALDLAVDVARKYDAQLVIAHVLLRQSDAQGLKRFAEVEGLTKRVEPEIKRLQAMEGRLEYNSNYDDAIVSSRVLVEVGQHILDDAKRHATDLGCRNVETLLLDGDPADQLLRGIKDRGVDCVIMGSRGLSDVKGMLLGSVSHKLSNRAPCTCITVK